MQKYFRSIKTNLIIIVFSFFTACNFNPGSYPYAEKYEINSNEPELIAAIKAFKNDNPQYNVPLQTQLIFGITSISIIRIKIKSFMPGHARLKKARLLWH